MRPRLTLLLQLLFATLLALTPSLILAQESFKDAKSALSTGRKYIEQGQFQEALTTFQRGYEQFKDPEFIFFSADALLKLQRYQESKETFEKYLQLQPKSKNKSDIDSIIKELNRILSTKVTINSTPSKASFWIDDQFGPPKGSTPTTISVPPGSHTLILQKTGSGLTRYNFEVTEGKSLTLNINLDAEPVLLKLVSDPKGAEIFLDGASIGFTPFQGEIPSGKHSLILKKSGFGNLSLTINEKPGKTLELSHKLPPPPGVVVFSNIEKGATITVNQKTSPLTERLELSPGEHSLTIQAPGFRPRTERVQLVSNKEFPLNAKLEPMGVSLSVNSSVSGATLLINDKIVAQTPMNNSVFIPYGEKATIRLEKDGFKPYQKKLSNTDGDFELKVNFRKRGRLPAGPFLVLSSAAALTATGGAFGFLAIQEDNRLNNLPAGTNPSQEEIDALRFQSNASTIGLSAGAVAFVGGAIWLRTKGGLTRSPGELQRLSLTPALNGATAKLSF